MGLRPVTWHREAARATTTVWLWANRDSQQPAAGSRLHRLQRSRCLQPATRWLTHRASIRREDALARQPAAQDPALTRADRQARRGGVVRTVGARRIFYPVLVTDPSMSRPAEYVVAEYQATQDAYLHYDSFRWQAGSLLVAGAFVFLGFLAAGDASTAVYAVASGVAAGIMTIWILFAHHHRQLYLLKIDRLLELEAEMGAEQHRRFNRHSGTVKHYKANGPAGHNLDLAVYLLSSLAAPALAVAKDRTSWWLLIAAIIPLAGLLYVRRNEALIQEQLLHYRGAKH